VLPAAAKRTRTWQQVPRNSRKWLVDQLEHNYMTKFYPQKAVGHALDHMCDSLSFVVVGSYWWLYRGVGGLIHILLVIAIIVFVVQPIQGRRCLLEIWTLSEIREVFGKKVVSSCRKILPKLIPVEMCSTNKFKEKGKGYEKEKCFYPQFSVFYDDYHLYGLYIRRQK
jgi:hypothetical protein